MSASTSNDGSTTTDGNASTNRAIHSMQRVSSRRLPRGCRHTVGGGAWGCGAICRGSLGNPVKWIGGCIHNSFASITPFRFARSKTMRGAAARHSNATALLWYRAAGATRFLGGYGRETK
jgi:hypothetical protein